VGAVTTFLDVETADFLDASRSMCHEVGDPIAQAVVHLQVALGECGSMAGVDPGGAAWAASYDKAAAATLVAAEDVVNATYRVGAMFEQSARNYAAADAASGGHPVHVPSAGVFAQSSVGVGLRPPSAHGGGAGTPPGWFLVEATIGRIWPDGHQDRLLAAASAWDSAASTLTERADLTALAGIVFGRDRLPEADDMGVVCESLCAHIRAVAGVLRQLAESCRELAHHIGVAHSEVEHELVSLVAQSAAIELAGAALSVVTLGAAEAPTQAVEGRRVAAAAARIAAVIEKFGAAARLAALKVADAADRATQVAAKAKMILGVRLSAAEFQLAARYPRVAQALRERLAIYRLEGDAGHVILRKMSVSPAQAERKFKHAADLGLSVVRGRHGFGEFAAALQRFVRSPETTRIMGVYRNDSAILSYNRKTMMVVVQRPNGTFWTCYRMTPWQLNRLEREGRIGFERGK
jgi:colicin D